MPGAAPARIGEMGVMTAAAQENLLRLAAFATGDGIGCHYRLRAEQGLTVELLTGLGLVKPIRQRIPTCDEHPCPLRQECRFARVFADGAGSREGVRSGKKFRLSPAGQALLEDEVLPPQIAEDIARLPLSRRILDALTAAGGTVSVFALNTVLLEASIEALLAEGDPGEAAFTRASLAAHLALLDALGLIRDDGRQVTRLADATVP